MSSFPLTGDEPLSESSEYLKFENEVPEGLSNMNGKHTRLLINSTGGLRYFGESSPLSLLHECRAIFKEVNGESVFTVDPKKGLVLDEPYLVKRRFPVPLPTKELCGILMRCFETNINDTFYVFDMEYFNENVLQPALKNPLSLDKTKLCLLYLVLANGAYFAELSDDLNSEELESVGSSSFLDSGTIIMRDLVYDGRLWLVEANFLRYFYYQSSCRRSSSWINLGLAIRIAQALGIHRRHINERFNDPSYVNHRRRLFRSLYICDRISSINLGRPLAINDYDCDDFKVTPSIIDSLEQFRSRCQIEISHVAQINGKILENIYKDGMINIKRARALAIELKLWSLNLPPELDMSNIQKYSYDSSDGYLLVLVHLSQLYGIMLLTKPFMMHVLLSKLQGDTQIGENNLMHNFCKASIRTALTTIRLIHCYMDHRTNRLEVFTTTNCCLFAALIVGLTLFEHKRKKNPNEEILNVLIYNLQLAEKILYTMGKFNPTAARWSENVQNMLTAIIEEPNSNTQKDTEEIFDSSMDLEIFKEVNLMDIEKDLTKFQQKFLPPDNELKYRDDELGQMGTSRDSPSLDAFLYNFGRTEHLFDRLR